MEHAPYQGLKRKLVLAFDIGTTFSGVSYCMLDPGSTPEVKGVTKFPAFEQVSAASKIPTVIYYDSEGKAQAIGAETLREGIEEEAAEKQWVKAEWFKLHVRPRKKTSSPEIASKIPLLPLNKSVTEVLADYISYLFDCTKSYIRSTHANGPDLWESIKGEIHFVLSHPNGWEGYQQTQLRQAAVKAGLITSEQAENVSFISEGEASLWFALKHGLPKGPMEKGEGVVIIDAGGGTIDISTYQKPPRSKRFEETSIPQCHFHGSIFITIAARLFLQKLLKDSAYLDDIDHIVSCFDKTTKIRFADDAVGHYIKFGSTKDHDDEVGIKFGQLKLNGHDVAAFFEPSIQCIAETVEEMVKPEAHTSKGMKWIAGAVKKVLKSGARKITHVVLVGGLGSSDWLLKQVKKELEPLGLTVIRPDVYVNKAVSDGAIAFHLSAQVQARIAKYDYGVFQWTDFDAGDPDHKNRSSKVETAASGRTILFGVFKPMLKKGTRVTDENEFSITLWREASTRSSPELNTDVPIYCYTGPLTCPKFHDMDPDNFRRLCSIKINLSHLPLRFERRTCQPTPCYTAEFRVIFKCNSAEIQAQVAWVENGREKRSPASMMFYQD